MTRDLFTEISELSTFPSVFSAYTYAVGGGFFWQVKEKELNLQ